MPRYDYECESCSNVFELRQSFDSEPVATCPKCEGRSIRKFHAVPVMFKGSGWYVNDYGKKSSAAATASTTKGDSDSSSSKSESKSETKSESKTESKSASSAKSESSTTTKTSANSSKGN